MSKLPRGRRGIKFFITSELGHCLSKNKKQSSKTGSHQQLAQCQSGPVGQPSSPMDVSPRGQLIAARHSRILKLVSTASIKVPRDSTRPQDMKWFPRLSRQLDIPKLDCEERLSPSELSDRFCKVYFALQVERKDGIEYRRGLGKVRRAAKKNRICNMSTRSWGNDVSGSPSGASMAGDSGVANGNSGPAGSRHSGGL